MATHVISGSRGLYTNTGSLSIAGALRIAQDVVIRRPVPIGIDYGQIQSGGGLIEPRRSYEQFSQFSLPTVDSPVVGMFEYDNQSAALGAVFYLIGQSGRIYRVDSPTVLTPIAPQQTSTFSVSNSTFVTPPETPGLVPDTTSWSANATQTKSSANYVRSAQMNGNVYFCTKYGVYCFDSVTGSARPRPAGIARPPDPSLHLELSVSNPTLFPQILQAWSAAAYRVVWGFRDANGNLVLGPPSGRVVGYTGNSPGTFFVQIKAPAINNGDAILGRRQYLFQLYRTDITSVGTAFASIPDPGDAMTLLYQANIILANMNPAGNVVDPGGSAADAFYVMDVTPNGFIKGPDLYTNANQEGVQNGNSPPPACADIASFKGVMFYANCSGTARNQVTVIGPPQRFSILSMTVSGQDVTITMSGFTPSLQGLVTSTFYTQDTLSVMGLTTTGTPVWVSINGSPGTNVNGDFFIRSVTSNSVTYHVPSLSGVPVAAGAGGFVVLAAIGLNGGEWVASASQNISGGREALSIPGSNPNSPDAPRFGLQDSSGAILGGTPSQNINLVANAITVAFGHSNFATASVDVNGGSPFPISIANIGGPTDPPGILSLEAANPGPLRAPNVPEIPGLTRSNLSMLSVLATKTFGKTQLYPDCGSAPLVGSLDLGVARLAYSKTFQPEAVPLNSYVDIGDKGAPIRRIIATRDNLFIFKDDGVYRLSDDPNSGAKPSLYDPTLVLVNPNLVCTIDNQVFMLSTRGFFQLSNVGAKEFGLNIRDLSTMLIEAQTTSLPNICIANERDQMIYFTLPGPKGSVWSLAYSLITHTWTQSSTLAAQAPATWPGLYYKGTLSSSLKSLHSGVILRHSNRDVSVAGAHVTAGDIFQEAVIDQNDNFLATNLVSDPNHGISPAGTIQEALNCLPPPGDRYYFDVTSVSGSTISMSPLSNTMGITPNVGDAIYQLGQTTQYWIVTAVNGPIITVSPYGSTTNIAPSTTGTTTFHATPGACQLLRPLSIAVEWSGFNAGNDSKLKHWHGSAVFFDELCSQTDTFNIYSYTEIDQVPQAASWPPAGIVAHPVYAARILLPVRHQRSRRVHIGLTGGQALKFTVISGVAYDATEHSAERESE